MESHELEVELCTMHTSNMKLRTPHTLCLMNLKGGGASPQEEGRVCTYSNEKHLIFHPILDRRDYLCFYVRLGYHFHHTLCSF